MTDLAQPVSDSLHWEQPQGDKDPAITAAACAQMKAHSPISTSITADGDTRTTVATAAAKGDDEGELGAVSSCNQLSNNHKHAPASEKHEHACPAVRNPHPSLLPTAAVIAPNTPSHPPVGTEVAQAHDPASLLSTGAAVNAVSVLTSLIPSTPDAKSFQKDNVVIAEKGDVVAESEIPSLSFSSETIPSTAPHPPCIIADKPSSPCAFTHLETRHISAPASDTLCFQSSTCSSSSSSLSEYLIIGQEQVESEFDDQQSERSYSSRDSFYGSGDGEGEHYHEGGETSETSQDSQSEDRASTPQRTMRRRSAQQQHHHHPSAFSDGHPTDYQQDQQYQYMFIQQQLQQQQQQQQQRITQSATGAAVEEEEEESLYSASSSSSARASSPVLEKTRKRRSRRVPQEESHSAKPQHETSSSSSSSMGRSAPLPALKLPSLSASLGGLSKSIFEFVLASVVCLSLLSCMFAFSYVSSGTKHLLGWYADQHIGQRIRDGIKEREHLVQEALEKMAGEEYAKVKRRSRQQYQHQQQPQQPQHQPPYGNQNRYQQQYQQQREQRQQERDQQQQQRQQQKQRQQEEYERGRLSAAEWQELIRAASMSFMAKFTASPAAAGRRR